MARPKDLCDELAGDKNAAPYIPTHPLSEIALLLSGEPLPGNVHSHGSPRRDSRGLLSL